MDYFVELAWVGQRYAGAYFGYQTLAKKAVGSTSYVDAKEIHLSNYLKVLRSANDIPGSVPDLPPESDHELLVAFRQFGLQML